jgi:hypothetical protein
MTEIQDVTGTAFIVAEYRRKRIRNRIRFIAIRLFRCFLASGRGKQPIALPRIFRFPSLSWPSTYATRQNTR